MTRADLNNIFRQIVIDMKYNPGYQIDSYRLNDSNPNLADQAFGSTYQDYVDGMFWSRKFAHAGADPNMFCGSYPVLMAENRSLSIECLDSSDISAEYYFLVVDKIPCDDCPPYQTRNSATVSMSVVAMLRSFLKELLSYGLYRVERSEVVTYEYLSDGRHTVLVDEVDDISLIREIQADIGVDEIELTEWGNEVDKRGWMAKVTFTLCEPVTLEFDYNTPIIPGLASINCPC